MADIFREVVRPRGRRSTWMPHHFVDAWVDLVRQAGDSYVGGLYEYEDELSVRDDLDRAIQSDRLKNDADWTWLEDQVLQADSALRELLSSGPIVRPGAPWWHERLPCFAGEELVEDAKRLFGVVVELR